MTCSPLLSKVRGYYGGSGGCLVPIRLLGAMGPSFSVREMPYSNCILIRSILGYSIVTKPWRRPNHNHRNGSQARFCPVHTLFMWTQKIPQLIHASRVVLISSRCWASVLVQYALFPRAQATFHWSGSSLKLGPVIHRYNSPYKDWFYWLSEPDTIRRVPVSLVGLLFLPFSGFCSSKRRSPYVELHLATQSDLLQPSLVVTQSD